jgi:phage conserved hypothetical protein, phiE125 gp8 family
VLSRPPVLSVTNVFFYDDNDTQNTFAASKYYFDDISDQPRIVLRQGQTFPTVTSTRNANAYQVLYVAGYGNASAVPMPIKHAIKLLAGHFYENRDAVTSLSVNAIPYTIGANLQGYKVQRLNNILGG